MSRTKTEEGRPRRKEDLQEAEESRGPQKAENFPIANFFFFFFFFLFSLIAWARGGAYLRRGPAATPKILCHLDPLFLSGSTRYTL